MADYRIRTVTQVLENIAFRSEMESDSVVLSDFAQLLAIPLRDGCDLMDIIGQRLRAQVPDTEEAPASQVKSTKKRAENIAIRRAFPRRSKSYDLYIENRVNLISPRQRNRPQNSINKAVYSNI